MAGGNFEEGLRRVRRMEENNRTTEQAKGMGARTPRNAGARAGFASNPTSGASISRVSGTKSGKGRKGAMGRVTRKANAR